MNFYIQAYKNQRTLEKKIDWSIMKRKIKYDKLN